MRIEIKVKMNHHLGFLCCLNEILEFLCAFLHFKEGGVGGNLESLQQLGSFRIYGHVCSGSGIVGRFTKTLIARLCW